MKSLQLSVLFCVLIFANVSTSKLEEENIDPAIKSKIDDFIENVVLPNAGVSALGLSIVRDDDQKVLYTRGYGMANQDKQIPNGNETQFLIGSITKSLTATVVVKVLSEKFPELGEAVLDTPIRKLIPSANFTLIDRFRSEHGTFRDLLSHKMCFLSDDLQMAAEPFNSTAEIVYRQRYSEGLCSIRAGFQYNNQMFAVAAELIAHLANKSYESLVQDLLVDIGMLSSALGTKADDHPNMPNRAQPYYMMDNVSLPMNTELLKRLVDTNAAGGLWSTPNDMAKYMEFHLNLGNIGGRQVVPETVMQWIRRGTNGVPSSFKSAEDDIVVAFLAYGLGLMSASYDGWEYYQHSGYYAPYQSWFSLFPSQKLGIFTSSNQGLFRFDPMVLHAFIFETVARHENVDSRISRLMEQRRVEQSNKLEKERSNLNKFLQQFSGKRGAKNTSLTSIVGSYGSGSSGDVEILEKFNQDTNATGLYLMYGKWAHAWLEVYDDSGDEDVINLRVIWDTDLKQEQYAAGEQTAVNYARVYNQTLEFIGPGMDDIIVYGKFRLGVSLDKLPPIPWEADSC